VQVLQAVSDRTAVAAQGAECGQLGARDNQKQSTPISCIVSRIMGGSHVSRPL
jgi:hypothetical protein